MRIGILGPTKISELEKINKNAVKIIKDLSKILAESGNEIVVVPDKGSVSELFAKEYINFGGKKVYSIIPLEDKEFGYGWVNLDLGEKINCGTWRNQPEKMNEETESLLCLGYAEGVMAEIAYSKWFKPKPINIIKELIDGEFPKSAVKKLNLKYISYKKLEY
jgi:hypothetical protein